MGPADGVRNAMNTKRLITIAVAAMFLIGGVAAVGAAAPVEQASENATDAHEENAQTPADADEADDAGEGPGEADAAGEDANGVGPSDGLPEQAPDRVTEIHDTIESSLGGSIDHLGESLSDLLGDEEASDEGDTAADEVADDEDDGESSDA